MAKRRPRRTLDQVIGAELKRLRELASARQDDVAFAARRFGLNWTQPVVAALESGRRSLSLGEAGMLPSIANWGGLGFRPRSLGDFIPDTDEVVIVAPGHEAPLRALRLLYGSLGATHEGGAVVATVQSPAPAWGIVTAADRKAGRALGCAPEKIAATARALWGRGLEAERDRRVGDPAATAQKRGRVTRALVKELARNIKRRR